MSYVNNNLIPEIEADLGGLSVEYHQEFGSFQNVSEVTDWVAKKLNRNTEFEKNVIQEVVEQHWNEYWADYP
tara:strand:- start:150 stop:365 length:216 start_codon:yes stop_codon:yes gene_type:complete